MGEIFYETGNRTVDAVGKINITGNIIPEAWYKTIQRENGKPNLIAILLLADIVYWYKPSEIRDEASGEVISYKKKFKDDMLQRSYKQIAQKFAISKGQAQAAVDFLRDIGVVHKEFRTVTKGDVVLNNVLYLDLNVVKLLELTYPSNEKKVDPIKIESERVEELTGEGSFDLRKDPFPKELQTNTYISKEISTKSSSCMKIAKALFPDLKESELRNLVSAANGNSEKLINAKNAYDSWLTKPSDKASWLFVAIKDNYKALPTAKGDREYNDEFVKKLLLNSAE